MALLQILGGKTLRRHQQTTGVTVAEASFKSRRRGRPNQPQPPIHPKTDAASQQSTPEPHKEPLQQSTIQNEQSGNTIPKNIDESSRRRFCSLEFNRNNNSTIKYLYKSSSINIVFKRIHIVDYLVMAKIHWNVLSCVRSIFNWFHFQYTVIKLTFFSLCYNEFADKYYIGDTIMEPMFWFVDHFTKILGPICVIGVIFLTSSIIVIAYAIGLPFYLKQGTFTLSVALIIGHWLLVNVVFYYYMSYMTDPGYPPQGAMITEAVSICKKCIAPKPPRTHHCSVCNRCILKMDHHCPWLNNCIGHFNHRYFFMFCAYAWMGAIFVMLFGIPVAYEHFFESSEAITTLNIEHEDLHSQKPESLSIKTKRKWSEAMYHSCIVYAALLCIAVFFVLGGLLAWHSHLISKGETSIEGHINKKERKRLSKEGKVYKNIYDFGPRANWKLFLGINCYRPWWHILLPFKHEPYGDGLQWETQNEIQFINENLKKKTCSKSCLVKLS